MATRKLGSWTNTELHELMNVLHQQTGDVDRDMSDPKEVRLIIDEIQSSLSYLTPRVFRRTRGEILGRIRTLIRKYHHFVAFISKPEVAYDVEGNRFHIQGNYDMERETPKETRFRLDGFEHYASMKEVLEGSAIESVPWGRILQN